MPAAVTVAAYTIVAIFAATATTVAVAGAVFAATITTAATAGLLLSSLSPLPL
jgi:hypothetical protein